MQNKTTFLPKNELQNDIANIVKTIKSELDLIKTSFYKDLYPLEKDSYHFIGRYLKKIRNKTRLEQAITSQFFKSAYQAELISANSAHICLQTGLNFLSNLLRSDLCDENETYVANQIDKTMQNFKQFVENQSSIATMNDVEKHVLKICSEDDVLKTAVVEALKLSSFEGKIFMENGRQNNYVVELKEGCQFNLKPFNFMLHENTWFANNCKVMVIDGLVEKISELDHILMKSLETKVPMVIFALGFSEEVAATLKANQEKGLLNIQPVRIPSDLEHLNVVNDLAIVCGMLPVSSLKGDLISLVKYEELPTVEKIQITGDKCAIEQSSTKSAVAEQIKTLLEKRQENHMYEDIQNILDKRIKSLSSNAVNIIFPEMSAAENDTKRVCVDVSLRKAKSMLNYGIVNLKSFINNFETKTETDRLLYKSISECVDLEEAMPVLSLFMGVNLGTKTASVLANSSGFVQIDQ